MNLKNGYLCLELFQIFENIEMLRFFAITSDKLELSVPYSYLFYILFFNEICRKLSFILIVLLLKRRNPIREKDRSTISFGIKLFCVFQFCFMKNNRKAEKLVVIKHIRKELNCT